MSRQVEELLILTKTYPSPSSRYRETTCVAAITRTGELRRLFPVPYRFLIDDAQFRKWEWIRASVAITTTDRRPESRRIDVDSIELLNERVGTDDSWFERRQIVEAHVVDDFYALEERRKKSGETLGFIRPKAISGFDVTPAKQSDWSEEGLPEAGAGRPVRHCGNERSNRASKSAFRFLLQVYFRRKRSAP